MVGDPGQQRPRLLDLVGVHARGRAARRAAPAGARASAASPRPPRAPAPSTPRSASAELVEPVRLAVDLDVHVGLVADDRVHEHVDAGLAAAELHAHRVHEERHVVGDDVDRGVRRLPAVLLERRVVDAHARLARPRGRARSVQCDERGAVEVDRLAARAGPPPARRGSTARTNASASATSSGATRSRTRSHTDSMSSDSTSCVPWTCAGSYASRGQRVELATRAQRASARRPPAASRAGCGPAACSGSRRRRRPSRRARARRRERREHDHVAVAVGSRTCGTDRAGQPGHHPVRDQHVGDVELEARPGLVAVSVTRSRGPCARAPPRARGARPHRPRRPGSHAASFPARRASTPPRRRARQPASTPPGRPRASPSISAAAPRRTAPTLAALPLSVGAVRSVSRRRRPRRRIVHARAGLGQEQVADLVDDRLVADVARERAGPRSITAAACRDPALEHVVEVSRAAACSGSRPCPAARQRSRSPSIACAVMAMIGVRRASPSRPRISAVAA